MLLSAGGIGRVSANARPNHDEPETVIVTLHAKAGAEAELAAVVMRHWDTAHRLNLVVDAPHLIMRGSENGSPYIVEVLTWRDASIPDAAPPAIQAIWAEMNRLVEPRGGRPGLHISEVSILGSQR
jgi:hypothetical protein